MDIWYSDYFEMALHLGVLDAAAKALLAFFCEIFDLRPLRARLFGRRGARIAHCHSKLGLA